MCDDLYHMIYIEGKDPNCEEAVELRDQFPELFVKKAQSSKSVEATRKRLHYIRNNPLLGTRDYALAWGVCYETASHHLNRMEKAGQVRKRKPTRPDRTIRWEAITK